jgi:Zn-dependent protease
MSIFRVPFRMQVSGWVVVVFCGLVGIRLSGLWPGLVLGALIIVSLLLHELGHMLASAALGVPVCEFGLCFRGAYNCRGIAQRRRDNILISSAGPLVNLCLVATVILPVIGPQLAFCNFLLCVTNLLPLPSSDGMHILRELFASSRSADANPVLSEAGSPR